MAHIHVPRPFDRRGPSMPPVTPEGVWLERRRLIALLGLGGLTAAAAPALACAQTASGVEQDPTTTYPASKKWVPTWRPAGGPELYPAKRSDAYTIRRSLSPEDVAASHNNFYEFLPGKGGAVHERVGDFVPRPWKVTIAGEVEEERTVDVDELTKLAPLEERLYHFRCVEAWSMVVPWTGLPLAKLVEWCKPKATAKFVRFVSFHDPKRARGQRSLSYDWPYYEALRMDEATHPLSLLVTGIYGHGLPMQHGAPLRVIVPWKYGYKSPKSIVRIEFTTEEPPTFWNDAQPREYSFLSNVEPDVPHPRWSQATERDLTTGDRIPTLPYNGYADQVAKLY